MSDNIKLLVNEYKGYVGDLKFEAENEIMGKPAESITGDVPSWVKYIDGCKELIDTIGQYSNVVLVSAQDFESSADLLVEADQAGG